MRRHLTIAAALATALLLFAATATAGASGGAGQRATVTHYTAHYTCDCFGTFDITGVHVTNARFPGQDLGGGDAFGGRDNFTGTVSMPPSSEVILSAGPGCSLDESWFSDYDGQPTCDYSVAIEPDGSLTGWAVSPDIAP